MQGSNHRRKRMLKSCQYCGKIHDSKFDCGKKPVRKFKKKFTKKDEFRSSAKWQHMRDYIRKRDSNVCQICVRNLHGTIDRFNFKNLSVHHIVSIEEDYDKRLDEDNLITLCSRHHEMAEAGTISKNELKQIVFEQNAKKSEQNRLKNTPPTPYE